MSLTKRMLFGGIWIILLCIYGVFTLRVPIPQNADDLSFYFSETKDDLKYLLAKGIRTAKESIFLSSFGITDEEITALLAQKEEEGVLIEVAFDPKTATLLPINHPFCKKAHTRSGLMHRKIVAMDQSLLFLGSTNITPSSLSLHRNQWTIIRLPALYRAIASNSFFQNSLLAYYPMPQMAEEAKTALIKLIDLAKTRIDLAIYTLTHKELIAALIRAKDRGVAVSIYIDQGMAKGVSRKEVKELISHDIYMAKNTGFELLHHKCCLIDNTSFVFGSANWTKAAFGKNQEYLVILNTLSPKNRDKVISFFHALHLSTSRILLKKDSQK